MTERKLKIGKVQVIFFKSSRRVLIPLALVISFTAAALGTLSWVEHRMARQTEDLRAQAAQISRRLALAAADAAGQSHHIGLICRHASRLPW